MRLPAALWFLLGILVGALGCEPIAMAKEKTVALMWVGNLDQRTERVTKDTMSNRVATGLLRRLRDLAPEVKVELRRDVPSYREATRLFNVFQSEVDGLVFLGSGGAQFLAKANPKIPCFVGGCNDPKRLGALKNLAAPDGKITGVTYYLPYEKRFELIKVLFPAAKSIGLIAEKGHPGGAIDREGTREQCLKHGMAYSEVVAGGLAELIEGTRTILGKVDLIIVSSTGLTMDNTVTLVTEANKSKTPLFSYAEKPVTTGAVAGLAVRDEFLGERLADSVVEVVAKGKPVSQIPVKTDPDPAIMINEGMRTMLGLTFPRDIMSRAVVVKQWSPQQKAREWATKHDGERRTSQDNGGWSEPIIVSKVFGKSSGGQPFFKRVSPGRLSATRLRLVFRYHHQNPQCGSLSVDMLAGWAYCSGQVKYQLCHHPG
ncbi:MAG: ABC transporter substrate binding protein [Thermodesulfobacteriota bacterium]